MTPVAQSASFIPVSENYGQPVDSSPASVASAIGGPLVAAPEGWSLARVYTVPLTIGFASGNDPDADAGATNSAGDSHIPVVKETTITVAYLFFEKGTGSLEVQIAPKTNHLAAIWAESLMSRGSPQPLGLGRGFANGASAVVETSEQLIRLTYDDGSHGGPKGDRDRISAGVLELAAQLGR